MRLCRRNYRKAPPVLNEIKGLQGRLSFGLPMGRYTTMRVGGPCFCLFQPDSVQGLIEAVRLCNKRKISFLAIGNGSNIIIDEEGTRKFLIRLSSPFFRKIEVCAEEIICGAGVSLNQLARTSEENSLGGAEFLVGIPGSVGGAIIQNAGAYGGSISDIIKDVKVLDRDGNLAVIKRDEIDFGYRRCSLGGFIVLGAAFSLKKRNKKDIQKRVTANIAKRLSTQDYTAPSAGCIFKNPAGSKVSAGELIENSGLKGTNIGGAFISERHANFIINKKGATAGDVIRLIALVKERVKKNFGVKLEEEVKIIR